MDKFWHEWNEALAYLLGFAYADGTVIPTRDTLILYQKDRAILDLLGEVTPVRSFVCVRGCWRARYTDVGLVARLDELGLVPNKTYVPQWPVVPDEMLPHYVRGYLDGDGSVSQSEKRIVISFVCHVRSYLVWLSEIMSSWDIKCGSVIQDGGNFRLRISSHRGAFSLYKKIYCDATLFLDRKRKSMKIAHDRFLDSKWHRERSNGYTKLLPEDVRQIRTARSLGESCKSVAGRFGICAQMVSRIARNEAWKSVQ